MGTSLVDAPPSEARVKALNQLQRAVDDIGAALPEKLQGQEHRLISRAALYFGQADAAVRKCTLQSFARCVVQAAEFGLTIDGRLGYAVPFGGDLTFIPSWQGLVAVAKRGGAITNCYSDCVVDGDLFDYGFRDASPFLEFSPQVEGRPRPTEQNVRAAFSLFTLPGGSRDFEVVSALEIAHVRANAPSKNSPAWKNWFGEMARKTAVRRHMKRFADDPCLVGLMQYEDSLTIDEAPPRDRTRSLELLTKRLDGPAYDEGETPRDDVIEEAAPPTPAAETKKSAPKKKAAAKTNTLFAEIDWESPASIKKAIDAAETADEVERITDRVAREKTFHDDELQRIAAHGELAAKRLGGA